jgi:hypothetical protein
MITYVVEYLVSGSLNGSTESPLLPFPEIPSRDSDEDQIYQLAVETLGIINPGTNNDGVYGNRFITWMIIRSPNVGVPGASVDIIDPRTTGDPIQQNIADLNGVALRYIDTPFLLPQGSVIQVDGMTAAPGLPIIVRLQVMAPETPTEFLEIIASLCPSGESQLCDSVPQPIVFGGAGSAGVAEEAARCDHVHPAPDPDTVGCEVVLTSPNGGIDNGAVINAAIVALNATGGGTICLGPGDWVLDTSVQPLTNVDIKGAGAETVLIWRSAHVGTNDNTDRSLISFNAANSVSNVSIYNMTLNGLSSDTTLCEHCIRVVQSSDLRFNNLDIRNARFEGINISDNGVTRSTRIKISECTYRNNGRDSNRLVSCQDVTISACDSFAPAGQHLGIVVGVDQSVQRVTAQFNGNDTTASRIFLMETADESGNISSINIQAIVESRGNLARIVGTGTFARIRFENCTLRGQLLTTTDANSFHVNAGVSNFQLHGNYFEVTDFNAAGSLLHLIGTAAVEIDNNRLIGIPGSVVAFSTDSVIGPTHVADNLVVSNVTITDSPRVAFYDNEIDMTEIFTASAISIINSDIIIIDGCRTVNGANGIIVTGDSDQLTITNNQIDSFDLIGISVSAATGTQVNIGNNRVFSADVSTTNGITLNSRAICLNNNVEINGTGGAVGGAGIAGALDTIVRGNTVRHGAAQHSILFGAVTGYVCAENQVVAAVTLGGVPVRAANNDIIVA